MRPLWLQECLAPKPWLQTQLRGSDACGMVKDCMTGHKHYGARATNLSATESKLMQHGKSCEPAP